MERRYYSMKEYYSKDRYNKNWNKKQKKKKITAVVHFHRAYKFVSIPENLNSVQQIPSYDKGYKS